MSEVVTITMDGPGKNSLGSSMFEHLQSSLRAAAGRPVLITGAGDAFSAGLNLREVAGLTTREALESFLRSLDATCAALFDYPGPTVAWVNGHAIAGGCVVALCCDVRVATDHARCRVGLNEVPLGLAFPPKIMAILKHRVPRRHIRDVVLGGSLVSTSRAVEWGLLDEVSDRARERAEERAAALATHSATAYAAAKAELQWGVTASADAASDLRFYRDLMPMWLSEEVRAHLRKAMGR